MASKDDEETYCIFCDTRFEKLSKGNWISLKVPYLC